MSSLYAAIYRLIAEIPPGKVATYGQIASMMPRCTPRQVGYALAATPDDVDIPWHRVINARGEVSVRSAGDGAAEQKRRLLAEGVLLAGDRVDLERCGWAGPDWRWLEKHGYRVFPD